MAFPYSIICYRQVYDYVTRRVMLLYLASPEVRWRQSAILVANLSMQARVVCTCQVGFQLKFPLSSKLSALWTTYLFQNITCHLSSISVTNWSLYKSRKRRLSAVKQPMCDECLFSFRSPFWWLMINPIMRSWALCQRACSSMCDYRWRSWMANEIE